MNITSISFRVEVTGLEPATAWSQTRNATNCATPRCQPFPDLRLQRYNFFYKHHNVKLINFISDTFFYPFLTRLCAI